MPRPISWLHRLPEIRKSVTGSIRSHYERREIEQLFQIQPRAAQLLLEMMPTTAVGRSRLVEREALASFLDRINRAADPSQELERMRIQTSPRTRKKLRTLVQRDVEELRIDSLPHNLLLSPGLLQVSFTTIEELAQAMYAVARIMEADGDELARRFEVRTCPLETPDKDDWAAMAHQA